MPIDVVTFGCRLNSYESEIIRANAQQAGLADAVIFNTCAVTAEAERQARQSIRRTRKSNPDVKIIVTGCSAQIKPEMYTGMEEVDQVLGNAEKLDVSFFNQLVAGTEKLLVNDIMSVRETASHLVAGFEGRARAFVQVQNGCDHRCTFCIIPFGRGNSRSVPMGEIVAQTRLLVENGYNEIVLTGVDISDYGKDLPGHPTLGQMMRRLLALVPGLKRLRLSSIDAVEVDEDVLRLIAEEPRLMPHLHISLQAGDDMVLKRMKRRHSRKDALDFCARVRSLRADVVFGADIIAGFPTETEAMFVNTLELVQEADLTYLHVFPYSAREGTPAARMPQVEQQVRKERASRLREAGQGQMDKFYASLLHKKTQAVMETRNMARSDHFAPLQLNAEMPAGSVVDVQVTALDAGVLWAEIMQKAA